uniref:TMV resistance protein N-like n=1 Tax=Rhizophora mucronata TaxID=61149 RepID=A0A2P2ISW5_RHIMU
MFFAKRFIYERMMNRCHLLFQLCIAERITYNQGNSSNWTLYR